MTTPDCSAFEYCSFVPEPCTDTRTKRQLQALSYEAAARPLLFHQGLPGYKSTPLYELRALARELDLARIWVKDESTRFGCNAFKALGASFAVAGCLSRRLGEDMCSYGTLTDEHTRRTLGDLTFVTATDGNHGRGVAWAAARLGHKARVLLPKGSARARLDNIRREGAHAVVTDLNYDDTVRLAAQMAEQNGWILVQDTSWPGYETVPMDIMRGYTTLAREIVLQLGTRTPPSHIFLQAGVGSFAAAMAVCLLSAWSDTTMRVFIVEPAAASCLYRTAKASDGTLHKVTGPMDSMMAGLCCGEPSMQAWELLRHTVHGFLTCADDAAALGMRLLAHPLDEDAAIVSGESGAVTTGVLYALMHDADKKVLRKALHLDASSRVLLVSTEGNTDPDNYEHVVGLPDISSLHEKFLRRRSAH